VLNMFRSTHCEVSIGFHKCLQLCELLIALHQVLRAMHSRYPIAFSCSEGGTLLMTVRGRVHHSGVLTTFSVLCRLTGPG